MGGWEASSSGQAMSAVAGVSVIEVAHGTSMHAQASPAATSVLHCSQVARSCWLQRQAVTGTSLDSATDAAPVVALRVIASAEVEFEISACTHRRRELLHPCACSPHRDQ